MDVSLSLLPLASRNAGVSVLTGPPQTWIVTGAKGTGKTTFCQSFVQHVRNAQLSLGGILSVARFQDGEKIGIELQDLSTGETRLLGRKTPHVDYFLQVGCWYFNEEVLHWGNRCLATADGCDVVVFDECGILELRAGGGFTNGLAVIDRQGYQVAVVVVRPALVPIAIARWPQAKVVDLERLPG